MIPSEISGIHYLSNPFTYDFPNNLHLNTTTSTSLSAASTSDDGADDLHHHRSAAVDDDRKQRRMISNRESARRSRMRKQKHLDELWSQVMRLRSQNHNLIDKLNDLCESHDRVLHDNAKLREEVSDLRQFIADLQSIRTFEANAFADFDETTCNDDVSQF